MERRLFSTLKEASQATPGEALKALQTKTRSIAEAALRYAGLEPKNPEEAKAAVSRPRMGR